MASGLIGNEVPRTGLRVRVPCPPLLIQTRRRKCCFNSILAAAFLIDTVELCQNCVNRQPSPSSLVSVGGGSTSSCSSLPSA